MIKKEIIYSENESIRIDLYLVDRLEDLSRSEIQAYIKTGDIKVNSKNVKASHKLVFEDVITIDIKENKFELIRENLNLKVIYEDQDLIVVYKEKNMVVHPAPGNESGTLVNGLIYSYPDILIDDDEVRPGIVHRLDKDTSGLIIVARNAFTKESLISQFKNREVEKTYLALVFGRMNHKEGIIKTPIGRHPVNRQKMAVVPDGKEAITEYQVIEEFENYSLVKLKLITGRTHQIRVHFNHINHPIVGDPVYSKGNNEFKLKSQFLHASKLGLKHPRKGDYMEFTADLPGELEDILLKLRRREDGRN